MAKTHPVEEEMREGRKIRLSQRQEGGGQVRRGCNVEVTPEAEGGGAGAGPAQPCTMPGLGGSGQPSL